MEKNSNNNLHSSATKHSHVPMRMCVNCRKKSCKSELLRLVNINNIWTIDHSGKAQARGLYICNDKQCLLSAQKNKRLLKSCGQSFAQLVASILDSYDNKQ